MLVNCIHVVRDLEEDSGGPSRSISQMALALSELGCISHIFAYQSDKRIVDLSRLVGNVNINWIKRGTSYSGYLRSWQTCFKPDRTIVHVHGLWSGINHFACKAARRQSSPYIIAPRGMLEDWALKHKRWKKRVAYWLYQRRDLAKASALHATSPSEVVSIKRMNLHVPIVLVNNAVEVPLLTEPIGANPSPAKRKVLFLSRLHPVKGLENLIQAWCRVMKPDWECCLVGPGEMGYVTHLKKLCKDLGGAASISFHEGVSDNEKWRILRTADLFVLPSHSENFGMAIAEALGSAVPVITTRKTPWEEVETKNCGWWIEDNVEALEIALVQAMSLTDYQRQAMGSRGRELILEKYCWPAAAKRMLELYQSLL
jgi:glycosyltransferase involved in cell wall biosynthesis